MSTLKKKERKIRRVSGVVNEIVVYCGVEFYRYPKSKIKSKRSYFWACRWIGEKRLESLHRATWEKERGSIPKGHDIHHIDGNPLNNSIENLSCVSRKEHSRINAKLGLWSTKRQRKILDKARKYASAWHGSEAGLRWHREHAKESILKRKRK